MISVRNCIKNIWEFFCVDLLRLMKHKMTHYYQITYLTYGIFSSHPLYFVHKPHILNQACHGAFSSEPCSESQF